MNRRVFLLFIVLACCLSCLQRVYADGDPVTITVTGKIVASPCEVDPTSQAQTVNLNDIEAADLSAAGSYSDWVPFSISLINCPAGTTSVTATFTGTADSNDPSSSYVNVGTAQNVAVQLETSSGETKLGNGSTSTVSVNSSNVAQWGLHTRAYSFKGGVTPGTIKSVITVSFAYN